MPVRDGRSTSSSARSRGERQSSSTERPASADRSQFGTVQVPAGLRAVAAESSGSQMPTSRRARQKQGWRDPPSVELAVCSWLSE